MHVGTGKVSVKKALIKELNPTDKLKWQDPSKNAVAH